LILAAVLFAIALNGFLLPSRIVAGGFSGLAVIFDILFGFPIGISVILLNIPFLIANTKIYGKSYIKKALVGVIITAVSCEIFVVNNSFFESRVINSLVGGALMGVSLGLIFSLGYTTGGTDLAASLIRAKFCSLSIGTAIMICDFAVIILALAVTGDVYGVALALASIYVQSAVIDAVMKRVS
jgi:uncharacterized membrane-anchored protein YitT (DUF2179 family)